MVSNLSEMHQSEATCVLWGTDKGHQILLKIGLFSLSAPNYKLRHSSAVKKVTNSPFPNISIASIKLVWEIILSHFKRVGDFCS